MKKLSLKRRAIRGAWVVARHHGLADGSLSDLMSRDERVRFAIVAAWLAGYRQGKAATKDAARAAAGGAT